MNSPVRVELEPQSGCPLAKEVVVMRPVEKMIAACAMAGFAALAHCRDGNGLTVDADKLYWPRWQGRLSLGNAMPASRIGQAPQATFNPASASLSLMTDYYLSGSLLGPARAGGFRATSGVMVAPRSQSLVGLLSSGQNGLPNVDRRRVFGQAAAALPGDASVDAPALPYLGVGYTGLSPRGGWSFNADLGLMSRGSAVKLGRVVAGGQSLDDTLRDMRWLPLLQLGVSYSF
ncbi:MAG: hypothetical protein M3Y67_02180 [Pseudomonadota bacterium]|nr:hypothetical protein [Pseudomonadota bacterium]